MNCWGAAEENLRAAQIVNEVAKVVVKSNSKK